MPGLTQDRFLKELRSGKTQALILRQFQEKPALVMEWKRASTEFARQYNEASAHRLTSGTTQTIEVRYPTWQDEFIEVYEELGTAYRADPENQPQPSIPRAVRLLAEERNIEISLGAVMARLAEGDPQYDAVFCRRHTEAEAELMGPVEERYHQDLLTSHDPRLRREALERHALTRARHKKPADVFEVNRTETKRLIEEHKQTYRVEFEAQAIEMFGGGEEPNEQVTIDVEATRVLGEESEAEEEEGGVEEGRAEEKEEVAATG